LLLIPRIPTIGIKACVEDSWLSGSMIEERRSKCGDCLEGERGHGHYHSLEITGIGNSV